MPDYRGVQGCGNQWGERLREGFKEKLMQNGVFKGDLASTKMKGKGILGTGHLSMKTWN